MTRVISAKTAGEAWLKVVRLVYESDGRVRDGSELLNEVLNVVVEVEDAQVIDDTIERFSDRDMISWMKSNFLVQEEIPEFGFSYAQRLRDYQHVDQIKGVIDRIRRNPEAKSATISLLMPGADIRHVPCISTLDFKQRGGKLNLIAFVRSQDVARKLDADILALGEVQKEAASGVGVAPGSLTLHVASAHIYHRDLPFVEHVLRETTPSSKPPCDNAGIAITYVSRNKAKIEEATRTLGRFGIQVISKQLDFLELQDDDIENVVRHKVEQAAKIIKQPVVVDDTGVFLSAYEKFPGALAGFVLRSLGYKGFLNLLNNEDRTATMETAAAIHIGDIGTKIFRGKCIGRIAVSLYGRGNNAFPFDRLFIPEGETRTFAEMDFEEKSRYSARVRALELLGKYLIESVATG
jgi:XTP/dITP diphosphohydrolase